MIAFLLLLAALALIGAVSTVALVLRDGHGPVRAVEHHDTRWPAPRD